MTALLSSGRDPQDVESMTVPDIVEMGTRLRMQAGLKPYEILDDTPEEEALRNMRQDLRRERQERAKQDARAKGK